MIRIDNTDPTSKHKQILNIFWDEFSIYQTKQKVIEALIELGTVKIEWRTGSPARTRYRFEKNKGRNLKRYKLSTTCFACGGKGQCRHHLIWIKNGGANFKSNIVTLCNNCHAEVHPWLKSSSQVR